MRNLKRTLSLVLAAVMLVGMMVVSASAVSSDFNDSAEITNTEAVDVMTAIGVFEGTDKGAFNPTGILTREQAAKIVAVMLLGEEDASKLTTNSTTFKDVAANRWSAGYIGYCVQQGILAGTGNGNFDPEGELTGLAFAKMMLVALGYDAKVANYVGNDWAINVAADAVNAGIAPKGIVLADAMTREQAAQMAFQTLTADTVYYTNKGTTVIGSDGMQVIVGASAPVKVANSTTDDYRTVKGDKDEVQQFCEKYFSDLTLNSNNHDDFGRPSDQWKNGTKEIGTYASTADASYSEKVSSKTLYSDLGLDKTTTVDVTEDGKANGTFTIEQGNSDDELGGNLVYYCKSGSTVATMVFISDVSASSDDIVYVLSSKAGTKVKDSDNTYYEYKAVVNGEITTVKMDEELKDSYPSGNVLKTDILLNVIAYADAENEILDASACEEYSKVTTDDTYQLPGVEVKAEAEDGIIDLGGKSYAVSDDVEVYAVTKGKKIETGSLSDVEKGMMVTAIVKNGEIVTIFYGSTTSSGNDKAEIAGDVTTENIASKNELLFLDNGAYVLESTPNDIAIDVHGEANENMYFVFRTKTANDKVILTIKGSKDTVYTETVDDIGSVGPHYFYVQVIGEKPLINAGDGSMKTEPLTSGKYTWSIKSTGDGTLVEGTFTIR